MDVKYEYEYEYEYEYPWPSVINVANFVTVKPCVEGEERSNFKIWKEQMLCLLESQDLLGFVNGELLPPEMNAHQHHRWRRTDRLVKGWILGSVGKDVLDAVWEKQTARDVWVELDNIFSEKDNQNSSGEFRRYLPLYQAALRGDWEFAKNFFQDAKQLCTTIITSDAETALHIAVMTGKANDFVKELVKLAPEELGRQDCNGDTALHNAAVVGNTEAAIALVDKNPNLLFILNNDNRLPLQRAVISSQKKTVTYLIPKYDPNADPELNTFQGELGLRLLIGLISSEFVDVALDLALRYPDWALLHNGNGSSALSTIVETSTLFTSTERFSTWQKLLYHCIPIKNSKHGASRSTSTAYDIESSTCDGATQKNCFSSFKIVFKVWPKVESIMNVVEHIVPKAKEVRDKKTRHEQTLQLAEYLCQKLISFPGNDDAPSVIFRDAVIKAAKYGNSEMVEKIIHHFPEVLFRGDNDTKKDIFLLAASNRFENVINLIYNMSDRKYVFFDCTDNEGNNLMHICGKLAPADRLNLVPGAALQMQRELQWFKEMEKYVHTSRRTWTNRDKQTPQMIFTKEHANLKADGERWMKDTANACTISAALIATVMFAAAFTIPGGLQSETGKPLFSTKPAFKLFAISDAISLFTSITSLLMFLSILTSRYAEEDFLYLLPKRLSIGLLSLFVSISFMMLAFSATLYLVLQNDTAWFLVLLAALGFLPATSFVLLQFPLLLDVVGSTYGPGIFGKKTRLFLY